MLDIIDVKELGIDTLDLGAYGIAPKAPGCQSCAVWRPHPQGDGNLQVET